MRTPVCVRVRVAGSLPPFLVARVPAREISREYAPRVLAV